MCTKKEQKLHTLRREKMSHRKFATKQEFASARVLKKREKEKEKEKEASKEAEAHTQKNLSKWRKSKEQGKEKKNHTIEKEVKEQLLGLEKENNDGATSSLSLSEKQAERQEKERALMKPPTKEFFRNGEREPSSLPGSCFFCCSVHLSVSSSILCFLFSLLVFLVCSSPSCFLKLSCNNQ
jgi:uncharacterized membrane protein YheB (UPF0754 family)